MRPLREIEARGLQRGAHAVARFLHLRLGQPHDAELRQASAHVRLHAHQGRLEPREATAVDDGDMHRHSRDWRDRAIPGECGLP